MPAPTYRKFKPGDIVLYMDGDIAENKGRSTVRYGWYNINRENIKKYGTAWQIVRYHYGDINDYEICWVQPVRNPGFGEVPVNQEQLDLVTLPHAIREYVTGNAHSEMVVRVIRGLR